MSYFQAFVSGLIQGLTEFLPVSSSGHLVLFSRITGVESSLYFDLILHLGTLVAVVIAFRRELTGLIRKPFSAPSLSLVLATAVSAVVVALLCVLIGLIIGGAFLKKRRAAQITGAAGLLIVSLAMVGSSAFMALGSPVRERYSVSYSDEELRLIIEETEPYFGGCTVAFYLTGTEDEGKAALLAVTDLNEFNVSDDRYKISWAAENTLTVGFEDGANYRQLTIPIDRSRIEE